MINTLHRADNFLLEHETVGGIFTLCVRYSDTKKLIKCIHVHCTFKPAHEVMSIK